MSRGAELRRFFIGHMVAVWILAVASLGMKGHVRQRDNGSWVFVLSPQELAQRCTGDRRHLHWVEGGAVSRCKRCDSPMSAPKLEWRKKWHGSFASPEEAQRALNDALGKLDEGRDPFPSAIRVHEFVPRWLAHKELSQRTRPSTLAGYRRLIDKYIFPEVGALRLDRVRVAHIQKILDKAAISSSARTVQQIRAVCSSMFSTAVKWEMITHNPVRGADAIKPERLHLEVPTAPQVNALIEQARETPWAVPILRGHSRHAAKRNPGYQMVRSRPRGPQGVDRPKPSTGPGRGTQVLRSEEQSEPASDRSPAIRGSDPPGMAQGADGAQIASRSSVAGAEPSLRPGRWRTPSTRTVSAMPASA